MLLVRHTEKAGLTSIVLQIRFGPDFASSPPYICADRARFLLLTQDNEGQIIIGDAICMEMLTVPDPSCVKSTENILLQVRMVISGELFARLEGKGRVINDRCNDYGAGKTAEKCVRACQSHG